MSLSLKLEVGQKHVFVGDLTSLRRFFGGPAFWTGRRTRMLEDQRWSRL